MKSLFARGSVLALLLLGAGCASVGGGTSGAVATGASVTRFHLGGDIARGEIAVEPVGGTQSGPEFASYAAAVEQQLAALGWRVVRGNTRSEQVALVSVDQGTREAFARRPAVSIGLGGGGFVGGGVGLGGGVSVPVGGSRSGTVVVTELGVRLQRRSDGTSIWEGRAQSEARAGTPEAQRTAAVARLAPALFAGFPGESGRTIRVP